MKEFKKKHENTLCFLRLSGLILLPILLSFISIDKLEGKQTICLFKNIFGYECYGCGITKAVISVIQLDFVRAFGFNKLVVVVIPLMIYLWANQILIDLKILKKSHYNLLSVFKSE